MRLVLFLFIYCLWPLLYPFIQLLCFFIPSFKLRKEFELKNELAKACPKPAKACFEISSEGELEQVYPLILKLLETGEIVELIFCSPSVEHRCIALAKQHTNLRIYRLPLISFHPFIKGRNVQSFITAKNLVLCRYDFFPELLYIGTKKSIKFFLLWATLKNKDTAGLFKGFILKTLYQSFQFIVAATEADTEAIFDLTKRKSVSFDLRPYRINQRLVNRSQLLEEKEFYIHLKELVFQHIEKGNRLIMGSAYSQDMDLLIGIDQAKVEHILIAPHNLDTENIEKIKDKAIKRTGQNFVIIGAEDTRTDIIRKLNQTPNVILAIKGVLCELYPDYQYSYIGGGLGYSVHSLLEPYVAGCFIMCGPRVHRSTEYDYILERNKFKLHMIDADNLLQERIDYWRDNAHQKIKAEAFDTDGESFIDIILKEF